MGVMAKWVESVPEEYRGTAEQLAGDIGLAVVLALFSGFPHSHVETLGSAISENVRQIEAKRAAEQEAEAA